MRNIATSAYHPDGATVALSASVTPRLRYSRWSSTKDKTTSICHTVEFAYNNSVSAATGLASNELYMTRLRRPLLSIFGHHTTTLEATKASPATPWNTATSQPIANGVRTRWCANNTPSLSPTWSAVIQRPLMPSNNSLSTPSVAGYISTTPPSPFARATKPTPGFSRRSHRSTGRVLSKL